MWTNSQWKLEVLGDPGYSAHNLTQAVSLLVSRMWSGQGPCSYATVNWHTRSRTLRTSVHLTMMSMAVAYLTMAVLVVGSVSPSQHVSSICNQGKFVVFTRVGCPEGFKHQGKTEGLATAGWFPGAHRSINVMHTIHTSDGWRKHRSERRPCAALVWPVCPHDEL